MAIAWKPNGNLNVSSDPTDLLDTDMTRCKNLNLERAGIASTRDGSAKINAVAIETPIHRIVEMSGYRYEFAGTKIYRNETTLGATVTSAMWSGFIYNQFNATTENIFALNGTDRKRIVGTDVFEWGIAAPTVAPTIATGALTGLTGAYNAKYTYARKEGAVVVSESDPSDAATSAVTLANESLSVTWTASADPQVTHVRIYRTLTGGALYYHDQDVAIGTLTVDTNTSDAGLGSVVETDHDRPPLGTVAIGPNYNGVCFIAKDNRLYYCDAKTPEYWPVNNYIEVCPTDEVCKALTFWNGQLYFFTKTSIYLIQGTAAQTFFPFKQNADTGAQGVFGVQAVAGIGIFHTGPEGVYLWNGTDKKITNKNFSILFRGSDVNGMAGIGSMDNAILHLFHNSVYFGYPGASDTYVKNFIVTDMDDFRAVYYTYAADEIRSIATDITNDRLLVGDQDGYVWEIEKESATDDAGTVISWEVKTKEFTPQTRRNFPRWLKYDVDASGATTATGVLILDGTTLQSHTLSGDRNTKRRLVKTGNGKRLSVKLTGTGAVEIYAIEGE